MRVKGVIWWQCQPVVFEWGWTKAKLNYSSTDMDQVYLCWHLRISTSYFLGEVIQTRYTSCPKSPVQLDLKTPRRLSFITTLITKVVHILTLQLMGDWGLVPWYHTKEPRDHYSWHEVPEWGGNMVVQITILGQVEWQGWLVGLGRPGSLGGQMLTEVAFDIFLFKTARTSTNQLNSRFWLWFWKSTTQIQTCVGSCRIGLWHRALGREMRIKTCSNLWFLSYNDHSRGQFTRFSSYS